MRKFLYMTTALFLLNGTAQASLDQTTPKGHSITTQKTVPGPTTPKFNIYSHRSVSTDKRFYAPDPEHSNVLNTNSEPPSTDYKKVPITTIETIFPALEEPLVTDVPSCSKVKDVLVYQLQKGVIEVIKALEATTNRKFTGVDVTNYLEDIHAGVIHPTTVVTGAFYVRCQFSVSASALLAALPAEASGSTLENWTPVIMQVIMHDDGTYTYYRYINPNSAAYVKMDQEVGRY